MRRGIALIGLAAAVMALMLLSGCSRGEQEAVAGGCPGGEEMASTCGSADSEAGCAVACASAGKETRDEGKCAVVACDSEDAVACAGKADGATCLIVRDEDGKIVSCSPVSSDDKMSACPHADGEECTCPVAAGTEATGCPKAAAGTCPGSGSTCGSRAAGDSESN